MRVCVCVSHDEGPGTPTLTLGREGRASANQSLEGTITLESVFICQGRDSWLFGKTKTCAFTLFCVGLGCWVSHLSFSGMLN